MSRHPASFCFGDHALGVFGEQVARFDEGSGGAADLLDIVGAIFVAFLERRAGVAGLFALRFGRGRHAAALNFGDCFSYALSVARDEPLLFVGDDFTKTDVDVCKW